MLGASGDWSLPVVGTRAPQRQCEECAGGQRLNGAPRQRLGLWSCGAARGQMRLQGSLRGRRPPLRHHAALHTARWLRRATASRGLQRVCSRSGSGRAPTPLKEFRHVAWSVVLQRRLGPFPLRRYRWRVLGLLHSRVAAANQRLRKAGAGCARRSARQRQADQGRCPTARVRMTKAEAARSRRRGGGREFVKPAGGGRTVKP